MKELFERVHFSPKGSSEDLKEEATYMLFLDSLEACQGITSDPSQGMYMAYIISNLEEKTFHVCFFPHNNRCRLSPMVLVF